MDDQQVPDLSHDEFDSTEEDNCEDVRVPDSIFIADPEDFIPIFNPEFPGFGRVEEKEEDNSEVDDETSSFSVPVAVAVAEKQSKEPEQTASFKLLIYDLKAEELIVPRTNNDGSLAGPFWARLWTDPGDETIHWASTFEYGLNPSWPDWTTIEFNNLIDWGFLYVEIARRGVEPCTSDGYSTVGRAKIRLPEEVDVRVKSRCVLVKSDGGECRIGVGHVMVTMEWERDGAVGAI